MAADNINPYYGNETSRDMEADRCLYIYNILGYQVICFKNCQMIFKSLRFATNYHVVLNTYSYICLCLHIYINQFKTLIGCDVQNIVFERYDITSVSISIMLLWDILYAGEKIPATGIIVTHIQNHSHIKGYNMNPGPIAYMMTSVPEADI